MLAIGRIPTKEEAEQSFARHHTVKGLAEDFGLTYERARKVAKEYNFPVCKSGIPKKATIEQLIDSYGMKVKKRVSAWYKTHEHPRGMLGKKHTKDVLTALRKTSKDRWENMTEEERHRTVVKSLNGRILKRGKLPHNKKHGSWKSDWRTIGGKKTYYRSRWEANYARYLEFLREAAQIANWLHEPTTFLFVKEQSSYLPDFLVTLTNGEIEYHEVKGWMDDRSFTKISLMRKYHPEKKLVLVRSKEYEEIERTYGDKISGWEFKEKQRKGDQ